MKRPGSLLLPVIAFLLVLCLTVSGVFAVWIYFVSPEPLRENLQVNVSGFYYDIAITKVSAVSQTVSSESNSCTDATVVQTVLTGNAGQNVVYEITAVNYSQTTTYVFSSATIDLGNGVTVVPSSDSSGKVEIPTTVGSNYISGTAIEPGETFTFYATYTLTGNASARDVSVKYHFLPVVYYVTYMDNNQVYAEDCIVSNNAPYTVRSDKPQAPGNNVSFTGWMNAAGVVIKSVPVGNKNNYTLSAKWDSVYSIVFVDAKGNVLYQEHITKNTTALSAAGQAAVNAALTQLQENVNQQDVTVQWSSYKFGSASDIIVRAEYTYSGILKLVPVYETVNGVNDGIVDYYRVDPVDNLTSTNVKDGNIYIPGMIGAIPVKEIERVTNEAGSGDWNNFNNVIKEIHVGEGTEILEHNSLSYTTALKTVYLPSTLKSMGKNTFSRNISSDKKVLTIHYAGTKADWDAVVNASVHDYGNDWAGGLKEGSIVVCTDGYYRCYDVKMSWFKELRGWEWHPHTYGTGCVSGCP